MLLNYIQRLYGKYTRVSCAFWFEEQKLILIELFIVWRYELTHAELKIDKTNKKHSHAPNKHDLYVVSD